MTLAEVLDLVRRFRKADSKTPIVLMGYYNPIHAYGTARFAKDAAEAGVDGLIIVDLPPEEDEVLRMPAAAQASTSSASRRRQRTTHRLDDDPRWRERLSLLCLGRRRDRHQELRGGRRARGGGAAEGGDATCPVAVGFGIKTPEQAARDRAFRRWCGGGLRHRLAHRGTRSKSRRAKPWSRMWSNFCECAREIRACGANAIPW